MTAEVIQFNRMYELKYHKVQAALWNSPHRFNVVPAGRRSGKTEIVGKRKVVLAAMRGTPYPDPKFFCAAPTRDQAKRIYWKDIKMMANQTGLVRSISESQLIITFDHNSEIHVLGMDKPERIEGTPWDGGVLDEFGNMKKETWGEHVRPALSDRKGWCDFIGVPEGRNHYFDLHEYALTNPLWGVYHWLSADILDAEEIKQAKEDLDELTYQQEYEGSFVSFVGIAYYNFNRDFHVGNYRQYYFDEADLIICLDFNEAPGVAAILQEFIMPTNKGFKPIPKTTTAVIGEVVIKKNSNTIRVCKQIIDDWGDHKGRIFLYGDATGGAGGSAKVLGSDWDLVKATLGNHFGSEQLIYEYPKANPRERARVNAVNSRLKNNFKEIYMVVDSSCKHVIKDFEGVRVKEDGAGEIDKKRDPELSHISDAIGYYVAKVYPVLPDISSGALYWK